MIERDDFLKLAATPHKVLTLPADAGQVEIRSLTGEETMQLDTLEDHPARAAFMLHRAMVEPAISEDDAREFVRSADAALLRFFMSAISDLSGYAEGAQKSD